MTSLRKVMRPLEPLMATVRPHYRRLRTAYLRARFPSGGFVRGNGVRVFCDFSSDNYVWYDADAPHLELDKQVLQLLAGQSDGSVFIDVGAHFGFYAAVFAEIVAGKGGRLIALEPDPKSFHCLQRTLGQFADVDQLLLPVALGDVDGEVAMYRGKSGPCLHSYREEGSVLVATVPSMRLDTLVAEQLRAGERIAMIKVDVDGAEPFFWRGAEKTLALHHPIVLIEFSPSNLCASGHDPRAFLGTLCDGRHAYWLSHAQQGLISTAASDYERIAAETGSGITDLVLATSPLDLSAFRSKGSMA